MEKIKISILPNYFLREDKTFDLKSALEFCGRIAGICYDKEGFDHLLNEPIEKTEKRIENTINNGHHSVYDHITINFNIKNIPKILAMVINNEKEYTTSEKSGRYTNVVGKENSTITKLEEELYNKWFQILKEKIEDRYKDVYSKFKIKTLAQENARSLVTVFMPTEMIYSTTLRQINYIASWMREYIKRVKENNSSDFEQKLSSSMDDFCKKLEKLNVLDERLMRNEKQRSLSLFGTNLSKRKEYFGDVYSTTYKGSYAEYAQAQRHRTIDYQLEILDEKEYYIPPIITDDKDLTAEWLKDMEKVKDLYPIGELVLISEMGKYEDFILKCKERLCTGAQLEIMEQTKKTLLKYQQATKDTDSPITKNISNYMRGARRTFKDFKCPMDCKFKEGKLLNRKI